MSEHLQAKKGDIASRVLLPGDPLRAKYIAEHFLENVVCYNTTRNMLGFTGEYKGKKVSVQGTGMGMPSIGIYAHELMHDYDVKTLIRIGTCGNVSPKIHLRDLILAQAACTDSNMNRERFPFMDYAPIADFDLLKKAHHYASLKNMPVHVGNVLTSDKFYDEHFGQKQATLTAYNVLGVEMETCELYTLAAKFNCQALAILTVSDCLITGQACSKEDRQTSLNQMIETALEII